MDKIAVAQTTSSGNWRENIEKAKQYIKKATEEEAVFKLQITICNKFRKMLRLIKKHTQGEIQKWKKDGTFTIRINN